MTELRISVDKVASFERGAGAGSAELKLRDGTTCAIDRELPHFDIWARLLEAGLAHGWYLYVAAERATGQLRGLVRADAVNVDRVEPEEGGGRLEVRFWQKAAVYTLRERSPLYAEMKRLLEEAARSKEEVIVTLHPFEMEVIDARPSTPSR